MGYELDNLIDQFERGTLNRRQFAKGVLMLTASTVVGGTGVATAAAAAPAPAIAPALAINHIHINVSDRARSEDFYSSVLGATVRERGNGITTMLFPGSTPERGCWLSLTNVDGPIGEGQKAGTYNHCGIAVDLTRHAQIAEQVAKRYPNLKVTDRGGSDQMDVYDPDGLRVQLMRPSHDGFFASQEVPDGKGGKMRVAKFKPGESI